MREFWTTLIKTRRYLTFDDPSHISLDDCKRISVRLLGSVADTSHQMSSTRSATLSRRRRPKVLMDQAPVLTLCHLSSSPQNSLTALLCQLFLLSVRSYSYELLGTMVVAII
jgi:hypothetical protein